MKDFEELYQFYQKDIYFFLLKLTGYEISLAEELTQETFYQAFFSLKNFRGECAIKSWLCQIAKNTYYRYLREVVKQRNLKIKAEVRQEEKTVSDIVEKKQMIMHIRKVIENLDEKTCSIVEYRLFSQMPYKEIGYLLGIREATVKVLFSRAKAKIQMQLKEEFGYEI